MNNNAYSTISTIKQSALETTFVTYRKIILTTGIWKAVRKFHHKSKYPSVPRSIVNKQNSKPH